jgi:hypothetical protein
MKMKFDKTVLCNLSDKHLNALLELSSDDSSLDLILRYVSRNISSKESGSIPMIEFVKKVHPTILYDCFLIEKMSREGNIIKEGNGPLIILFLIIVICDLVLFFTS